MRLSLKGVIKHGFVAIKKRSNAKPITYLEILSMGKAKRNKQLKRQQREILKKYNDVKLSQALIALCEPYKTLHLTTEQYESLISLSAVACNIAAANVLYSQPLSKA